MMKNKIAIITLASALVMSIPAAAEHKDKHKRYSQRFTDTARVTFVEPVYRSVRINRPERECWDEDYAVDRRTGGGDKTAGGVIGGILGGVAGHQVGKGRGKTAATIVGTLLGNKIGRDMSDGSEERVERRTNTETVCRTVNKYVEEERLRGYRVGYRYKGREYETFMKRRPGKRLNVRVKVVPLID